MHCGSEQEPRRQIISKSGGFPVDPVLLDKLFLDLETSLKYRLLVQESIRNAAYSDTKIMYPGNDTKKYCLLESFSFILGTF